MTNDGPRIDELRRRVENDPASIAFAPLAEELRRTGQQEEAVRVFYAGLEHHPTYLSAHLTLGRSLLELQQYPQARVALEYVLNAAPDNLIALRCMSELKARTGDRPPVDEPRGPMSPEPTLSEPSSANPVLEELEAWHARIQAERARRSARSVQQDPPR